jgi:uncharacterized membrane protein
MAVMTRQYTVDASVEQVRDLVTDLSRISQFTEVSKVSSDSAPRMTPGARWKNRGATLKLPSWDSSTATEVTDNRIRWHTRSMVLGVIPVGADWSTTIHDDHGRAEVTNTFEKATMFGIPIGALVKAPFLPMRYLAQGAIMAGEKRLTDTLTKTATL